MTDAGKAIPTCIERIEEQLGDGVAWTFGKITSDTHPGCGRGFDVSLTDGKTSVYEQSRDVVTATNRAITRYMARKTQSA